MDIEKIFSRNYSRLIKKATLIDSVQKNNIKVESDNELKKYILDHTENLKVSISGYSGASDGPLASPYTIPATIDPNLSNLKLFLISYVPVYSQLYTLFVTYRLLAKANIDGFIGPNNKIIFTHNLPKEVDIFIVQPDSFRRKFKNVVDQRFAIMLHEIGHWHSINPYATEAVFGLLKNFALVIVFLESLNNTQSLLSKEMIQLSLLVLIIYSLLSSYVSSINETNADKFAKKLGYGNQLAQGLYKFSTYYGITSLPNPSKVDKIAYGFEDRVSDFFERIFFGYPSMLNRLRMLKEGEEFNIEEFDTSIITNVFKDFNLEFIKLESFFIDKCRELDSLIDFK